ncbi:alpha/beta hydrolase family protein [Pseudalkalibacillus sp. SCS-8]|uniref:alpha/beta hydrolase n=1 Tax=Pseudalkalibacillus nanhaiensis TaxID=3115291 RepID=UPI0032DA6148
MPMIQCDFVSEVLKVSTSVNVILPQPVGVRKADNREKPVYPTLYLLHGLWDDHTVWTRQTSIERYVSSLGIAVVMPAVGRSFYTDMEYGPDYFTYITEELPAICQEMFPLSDKREDTYVAGLSMGGYGALKAALRCPENYRAAASLSGAVDLLDRTEDLYDDFRLIFGDRKVQDSEDDLFHLAQALAEGDSPRPSIYLNCGTEDYLVESNRRFRKHCENISLDVTYEEYPGAHEWSYWDEQIQKVLEYFFKENR